MEPSRVRQRIVAFIRQYSRQHGFAPAIRDIMRHCGFKSPRAVSFHLEKLERAGLLKRHGKARSLLVAEQEVLRSIPIYGVIPAGHPEAQVQKTQGEIVIRPEWFSAGVQRGYGLKVRGDSMQGARIFDGDIAIVEPRRAKAGDIVVALIDGESTLKRLVRQKDQYFLKAENPKYPECVPGDELTIQGVVVGIYRTIG